MAKPITNKNILDIILESNADVKGDLSNIKSDISEIKVVQAEQAQVLDEHMRRTAANEEAVKVLSLKREEDITAIHAAIEPLKFHVSLFGAAAKVVAMLAGLAAIGTLALKIYEAISG